MPQKVKLPYCSRYIPGDQLRLGWLKAATSNDYISARYLNWHAHDETELIFPLRGHYRYEFRKRHPVLVDSESFIVIPGGTLHRLDEAIDPPGVRLHLYLRKPSDHTADHGTLTGREYAQLYEALSRQTLRRLPASPQLKAAVAPLGKIVNQGTIPLSEPDGLQARFLCCLALCNAAAKHANAKDTPPSQTFAEAVSWLERNYATNVHMDRLIEHIGYSRARFFALFREQTNMTPSEYLRNYRLEKAKEMLLATDLPAVTVGKACGLGDPAHFSRLFSKMTGRTPLAYRRLKRIG